MFSSELSNLLVSLALVLFFIYDSTASSTSLTSHDCGSTKIPTTVASEAYQHGRQSSLNHQVQSVTSLSPRALSWNDSIGAWNIAFSDWEAFPPSDTTTRAIADIYTSLYRAIVETWKGKSPPDVYSLTYGVLRQNFQCIGQAIPWGVIDHFLQKMHALTSAGLAGLYTVAFYVLKGTIIWSAVVISLVVLPYEGEGIRQRIIT